MLKIFIKIVFFIVIALVTIGYYLQYQESLYSEKFIGSSMLILTFVLLPLFIYSRFKGGKYDKYASYLNKKEMENK